MARFPRIPASGSTGANAAFPFNPGPLQLILNSSLFRLAWLVLPLLAFPALAATRYVNLNNPTPAAPYTTWATAATNIQTAVDTAVANDDILVTNGVYQTGIRVMYGMSNRVAVTKAVRVQSVNGPGVTTITGFQVPITKTGSSAVRCVYLTNGAMLSGFTLTNGATQIAGNVDQRQSGGAVWCESTGAVISNCVMTGNAAAYSGGGSYGGTLINSTITSNQTVLGGGVYLATLTNCTLVGNLATNGGGAYNSTLNKCALTGNSAGNTGGGAMFGTLNNCMIVGNSALYGGGAYAMNINNSTITRNSAADGGGAFNSTLQNCTVTGNTAITGGGTRGSTLNNCIAYYNTATVSGSNYFDSTLNYSCTTPLPGTGTGNLTAEPQLVSSSYLGASSPCRGAGSTAFVTGFDIDGEPWANPPSIGCDEYSSGATTGPLTAVILVAYTNVSAGYSLEFQAAIGGRTSNSSWDFGDGVGVVNKPYASHAWSLAGDYTVVLRAYNETYPGGVATSVVVHVVEPVRYVSASSLNPVAPYTTWATAATSIQDAVDASFPGDTVSVSNGVYQTGVRSVNGMSNRVAVTKSVRVQSVNGPGVTTIAGYQMPGTTNGPAAIRCVYLKGGAVLAGFTLTNGATQATGAGYGQYAGGGVWCEAASVVVSNCVLTGNTAVYGGGAYNGLLTNCILKDNLATAAAGGAFYSTLNACTLTGNVGLTGHGGGAQECTLNNCTLTGNSAKNYGGGVFIGTLNNCVLLANTAGDGGGTYNCLLTNCALTANVASNGGGGAYGGTLSNCHLTNNSASYGGGAFSGALDHCTLAGNSAMDGGGIHNCTFAQGVLTGNSALNGGGAYDSTISNSALTGNSAAKAGGGSAYGTLNNCTSTGNSAGDGGGVYGATLNNCIVYYNSARSSGPNYYGGAISYSCTTPLPDDGTANLAAEPLLVSAFHLSAGSPCRGAGNSIYTSGTDIDGQPWATPPSIGCDEYWSGSATGELSAIILVSLTNVAGFAVNLQAVIAGQASDSRWDLGGGLILSNQPYVSRTWSSPGDYVVQLRVFNETYPAGIATNVTVHVRAAAAHYVSAGGMNPVAPFDTWATAATNIQDAVDAAIPGDSVVVSNGVYQTGMRGVYGMSNRLAVLKAVHVQSVNGPGVTTIAGYQVPGTTNGATAIRCVLLSAGARISGFTMINGATQTSGDESLQLSGGGVWCQSTSEVVSNCVLTGNSAYSPLPYPDSGGAAGGGGAYSGTLDNCVLTGNSAAHGGAGGGALNSTLHNCALTGNSAINGGTGGGTFGGLLNNCVFTGNSATWGGGASDGTMINCTLTANTALYGGGTQNGTLSNCVLMANVAGGSGGGAYYGTLINSSLTNNSAYEGGGANNALLNQCILAGNVATNGGGASYCMLSNCVLTGNSANISGGGAANGTLYNCVLTGNSALNGGGTYACALINCAVTGNSARNSGGGVGASSLNNCTLTGNSADYGGGAFSGALNNCIVYYNTARVDGPNYSGSTLNYSCTTPLPDSGTANLTAEPLLASAIHLSAGSPCRGAGSADYSSGVDVDGEPWANPPSIGCDEFHSGSVTGAVSAAILASSISVSVGFAVDFQAVIDGRTSGSGWDFGDGVVVSNRPYASHVWASPGNYMVELRAYNETYPGGIATTVTVHVVSGPIHYVAVGSPNPVAPYTTWATAAANIQDAVDAATIAGAMVLVTNGVYQTGIRAVAGMSNRVVVVKALHVQSVNGPGVTTIAGYQVPGTTNGAEAIRCVYLSSGATLSGFTLTNGATQMTGDPFLQRSGGGVWCESTNEVVSNCVLTGNSASDVGGGGSYLGTIINCTLTGNAAINGGFGGGAYRGVLKDCIIKGNRADGFGGGAAYVRLDSCIIEANSASGGAGGTTDSALYDCMVKDNFTPGGAGGVLNSMLSNCSLTGNMALGGDAGGAYGGTLNNCTLLGNSASNSGGGAANSTLHNCMLKGNSALNGGGTYGGALYNCTLTGNSARDAGGGANGGALNNCIVFYNTATNSGPNYQGSAMNYSCTSPLPDNGTGNLTAEPQLASASHLSASSPCRGAGSVNYIGGVDIDGEPWANPPSIGCDEYWSGSVTGALTTAILVSNASLPAGSTLDFQAVIGGRTRDSRWDFGDGVVVSNRAYVSHVWAAAGDYVVELRAYNESYSGGVATTFTVHVGPTARYVSLNSATPLAPYATWATAATNIQDALDASYPGDTVTVSNGLYQTGMREVYGMSNRVAVVKAVRLQSLNGPGVTTISGHQMPGTRNGDEAVRCVYLTNGAVLSGFTLTNGATQTLGDSGQRRSGGGVWGEATGSVVSNCVLTGNSATDWGGGAYNCQLDNCVLASNSAWGGGGARGGTLDHCTLTGNVAYGIGGGAFSFTLNGCILTGNSAGLFGGGTYDGALNNCMVKGNSAENGGGVYHGVATNCTVTGNSASYAGGGSQFCTLINCIVYYNTASVLGSNFVDSSLSYSCVTPLPQDGVGNISSAPLFVNQATGNLRLQAGSPCLDAGFYAYAPGSIDLDGNPRITGGTVDLGAYEFQYPNSVISPAWLQQYGLLIDGSADYADPDHDGMSNWQEWRAGVSVKRSPC